MVSTQTSTSCINNEFDLDQLDKKIAQLSDCRLMMQAMSIRNGAIDTLGEYKTNPYIKNPELQDKLIDELS